MRDRYELIVPIIERDIQTTQAMLKYWKKYLPIGKLVFIGKKAIKDLLVGYPYESVRFIDEDSIIPYDRLKEIISDYTDHDKDSVRRTGWYLQQFLKMEYARHCKAEYYFIWDADTAPLRPVIMFEDGHPVFHMKRELHRPYFQTINRLFPGMKKAAKGSFIAEHMLVNCAVMRELIGRIEDNHEFMGDEWYEKVIHAIDRDEIAGSGFSEYETFGTYCTLYHPKLYYLRKWTSCRDGNRFFDAQNFSESQAEWLRKEYNAISFERAHGYGRDKRSYWFEKTFIHKYFSYKTVRMIVNIFERIERIGIKNYHEK